MKGRIIILAGGISSRMKKPVSSSLFLEKQLIEDADKKAKAMIGLGEKNRPFLDYSFCEIKKAGYKEVIIVIGEKDISIKEYYGKKQKNNEFYGLNISYAIQSVLHGRNKPLGTADAVFCALIQYPEWKGSKFTIVNSDDLYSAKALSVLLETEENAMIDYDRAGLLFPQERIAKFAVTIKDKNNYLIDLIEKPTLYQIELAKDKNGRIGVSMNAWCNYYDDIFSYLLSVKKHPQRDEKELPVAELNMVYHTPFRIFLRSAVENHFPFLRRFNKFLILKKYSRGIKCILWKEHIPGLTSKEDILPTSFYIKQHLSIPEWERE